MSAPAIGSPDARELLATIRASLVADVLPATADRAQYVVRMSCRLLDIIERELAADPRRAEDLAERIDACGGGSEAELAAALLAGRVDADDSAVRALVSDLVGWRLAVARPDHPDAAVVRAGGPTADDRSDRSSAERVGGFRA